MLSSALNIYKGQQANACGPFADEFILSSAADKVNSKCIYNYYNFMFNFYALFALFLLFRFDKSVTAVLSAINHSYVSAYRIAEHIKAVTEHIHL